jgi:bifunctional DNA-binding transcriptional regulator/antitoxin component of YhaV-PrlF toxin-antitoxin module
MARRTIENRNIRKLSKRDESYNITLPIEYVRKLGWRHRQKLVVELRGKTLVVKDWE